MNTHAAAVCSLLLVLTAASGAEVRTPGLVTNWDDQGKLTSLELNDLRYSATATSGLWVEEVLRGEPARLAVGCGTDRATPLKTLGLSASARLDARPGHLLLSGSVRDDRAREDRAVDVVFRLPMAPALWWASISQSVRPGAGVAAEQERIERLKTGRKARDEKLPQGAAVLETVRYGDLAQAALPVAALTEPQQRAGLGVALPPDRPCQFQLAYRHESGELEVRWQFGLSPAAAAPWKSLATFALCIFPVDGQWGLRDALRQYYSLFPAAFRRRTPASGLWLFAVPSFKQVPDPQNYAFWEGPRLKELELARRHAIETYPYVIVGQREIGRLKTLPKSHEEVEQLLRLKPDQTQRTTWSWASVVAWVRASGLKDHAGRWVYKSRHTDWSGDSLTFPLNPSPDLPGTAEQPTIAQSVLGDVDALLREHPELSGIYVDSLASWGSFNNYRREHFAAVRAPLAHDAAGRACVPNWMPHIDFLRELARRVGPRLVFGNGIRPGRAFCAFACDILGVETSRGDLNARRNLDFYRAVAGRKPSLFLFYWPEEELPRPVVDHYVQRFVALGLSPEVKSQPWGRFKTRDAEIFARFVPIYRRLDLAGWQPVTHATLDAPELWLERFGTGAPELYFTLYNPGSSPQTAALRVDRERLGTPTAVKLLELVESRTLDTSAPVTVPPRSLRVLQLRR